MNTCYKSTSGNMRRGNWQQVVGCVYRCKAKKLREKCSNRSLESVVLLTCSLELWQTDRQLDQPLDHPINRRTCGFIQREVSDPVWYWPDPNPTSQEKPDPYPWFSLERNRVKAKKPDPVKIQSLLSWKCFIILWIFYIRNCFFFIFLISSVIILIFF